MGIRISILLAALLASGCHSITVEPIDETTEHVYVSRIAVHFALDFPFLGDATLESAIDDVKKQARRREAEDYVVVSSDVDYSFWRYFPLSIIFQPVYTTVSANLVTKETDAAPDTDATSVEKVSFDKQDR